MQVTITTAEKTVGLFKKEQRYHVTVSVIFSEEESAIIKKSKLGGGVLRTDEFVGPNGPFDLPLTIKELQAGPVLRVFKTPQKATLMEQEMREINLPYLKIYLKENTGVETKSQQFEL